MKQVTLLDFLTEEQITKAVEIYKAGGRAEFICAELIAPNIEEINKKLGQENDPMYLAYCCEYVLSKVVK